MICPSISSTCSRPVPISSSRLLLFFIFSPPLLFEHQGINDKPPKLQAATANVTIEFPKDNETSVLAGAALFGLNPELIALRIAKKFYMIPQSIPFDPKEHDEKVCLLRFYLSLEFNCFHSCSGSQLCRTQDFYSREIQVHRQPSADSC
jgi:hypothetical protein